jgi:membrane associated rhomboid family serine protease
MERLKKVFRSTFGTSTQKYDTSHRMCPNCRALVERNASVCPFCGEKLGSARARPSSAVPGRILGIIPIPSTATSAVVAATIALYAISWYMTVSSGSSQLSPESVMGGISGEVLLRLGAKSPHILMGQWWRLVTAIFLHAGLLHIGFNLWCLFDLGPQVESLFSSAKFVVFYLVAGVAGFLLSFWWSPFGMSVGASGSILGMIGVLIGASFHHGHLGKEYRGQLWRWVIYIFIFGLFFAVDNAAHIGGAGHRRAPGIPRPGRRRGDPRQPKPMEPPRFTVNRDHRRLLCPYGFTVGAAPPLGSEPEFPPRF